MILGALIRVTQHLNFAPVGAMSLFAGARLRGWQAYALPLALMAITDLLLGGYWATSRRLYWRGPPAKTAPGRSTCCDSKTSKSRRCSLLSAKPQIANGNRPSPA